MATVTAFILVTCAKNTDVQPSGAPLEPGVAAAKEAFGQYLQTIPKARVANFARLARQGSQRTIHWELAQPVETGAFAGIRVPVSYPGQRTAIIDTSGNKHPLGQNTWLLVQDDTADGYRFSMLTALPTGEYLAGPDGGYSGVLEVTGWNGELLAAYIYNQGRLTAVSSPARAVRANRPTLLMGVDNTGEYICVPVMAETCVGNPADPNDDYICNTQQVGQHCYFTGGNNGNPDFPPLDDLPEPEVWYGGGGGGNSSTTTDIHNDLTDPCLKALLTEILNKQFINRIGNILEEFDISETVSLDFTDTNLLPEGTMGQYNDVASTDGRFQIDLNKDLLSNASKEYATATIIHETIHAYLARQDIDMNFQHQEMFLKYRTTISDALVQMYGTNQQLADDLAFAGLTVKHDNYDWWDWYMTTIPQNTRSRILNRLYEHQKGNEGTKFCDP